MKKLFFLLAAALVSMGINAQQLNEDFEGDGFPPEDWSVINANQYSAWRLGTKEGTNCAMAPSAYNVNNYLITPQLKPANGEQLHFMARIGDFSNGQLNVEVSLSDTQASSFTAIATYSLKRDAADGVWKSDWKEFTIDLSAYKNQRIFIAFHPSGDWDNIYIDNVSGVTLAGNSNCDVPTRITVSAITDEGATVSWQGTAAQYQYVVLPQGSVLDWSSAVLTSAMSVTLTGLDEDRAYDFYVRSYCSATEQSLAPKTAFRTTCALADVPWLETFTRDATGAIAPECWTVASSTPQVWVVADKTYDDEGNASTVYGQAHLYASGGGTYAPQVFALPAFNARLDTLEIAFDYKTNMVSADYGVLEIGYMTNPSDANSFVSLQSFPQTLTYQRATCPLSDLPATAAFIAFRFAGGTSDFGSLSMDNFVVAAIGHSGEIDPADEDVPDASIWALTYCEAQFTWYAYNSEAFAIGLFDAQAQQLIAGIVATTEECDRFAYQDSIAFSEYDDYENHFYCSTKWILNVDEEGLAKGEAWNSCVLNIGTAVSPLLGLRPGNYQVQIYPYSTTTGRGELLQTIPFELVSKEVSDLQATVAADQTTATLTWTQPELATGERLYVSVRAGETVAYDNFDDARQTAVSPLTVNVTEGKSYTATIQVIDKHKNPLGHEVSCLFTVGTNPYEPANAHAEVFGGDNVTFSWDVTTPADFYDIVLFLDGAYYTTTSVYGNTKTTTMPKDGTWSWTVQAFTEGSNGKYFPASHAINGNDFVTQAADIPEDAIVMDVWGMEAAYLDEASGYYQEGLNGWFIMFATDEAGGTGYPMPSFLIYTAKERAISGVYNVPRQNIDLESCYINVNGRQSDAVYATDAELRLQFDGFDDEKAELGYAYGYYTGSFRLVGDDGKTYVGRFMELFCNSFNFSTFGNTYRDHVGMYDEDPDELWGIENIAVPADQPAKVLHGGTLYIVRPDGTVFNTGGMRVR